MPCLQSASSFLCLAIVFLGAGFNLIFSSTYVSNVDNFLGAPSSPSSWDEVKNSLCPNSIPQIKHGRKLFDLARNELGLQDTRRNDSEEERLVNVFFAHPPGVSAYYHPDSSAYNVSIIYIDNKKAASTQIKHHFRASGYQRLETRDLKSILNQDIIPVASDVCVVTAIRDPIERFLSGYTELETRVATIEKYNVTASYIQTSHTEHEYGDPERFEDFMKDFLTNPGFLRIGGDRQRFYEYTEFLRHLYLQSRILTLVNEAGAKLTGYLPSIEDINEKWPRFMTEHCPSAGKLNHPETMSTMGQHKSSKDEFNFRHAANFVWEMNGPTAKALCYLHAMDYACFDELPNGVLKLCKEIYSSEKFRLEMESTY